MSCMFKKYSGNYGKNFQFKVTSIADKSQVTPSTGNYRRGEGCNLFEYTYRYEMQKQYGIFNIFPLLCTANDYNSFSACETIHIFGSPKI